MRFIISLVATAQAYLATPDAFIQAKDGHCVSTALTLGCRALNGETSDDTVTRQQIEAFLAQELDEGEVADLLATLLPDEGDAEATDENVECAALCTAEVHRNQDWLPWTVETGCVGGEGAIMCDVDLAFDALHEIKFTENGEKKEVTQDAEMAKEDDDPVEVRMRRAERMLLRAFRSFPYAEVSAEFNEAASEELTQTGVEVPAMMAKRKEQETALETAVGEATEAFLQQKQAAPAFLQTKQAASASAWSMACLHHADFRANSGLCPSFLDAKSVFLQMGGATTSFVETEGCLATCSLVTGHAVGPNGCESCEAFVQKPLEKVKGPSFVALGGGDWRADVAKVSLKAQSYLEKVSQGMARGLYGDQMALWYGSNDEGTRTEVRRILASVSSMIDNVDYVYPGPQCSPNTYAYVYPNAGRGYTFDQATGKKFNFFLCPYYMKVDLGEQIETLTHEGSHHRSAYTDDVPHPTEAGQKAYGRGSCKSLARRNRASALKNADSFCYFTQDAAESAASVAPAAPVTPAPKPTYVRPAPAPAPAYVPVRPYTPGSYPSSGTTYYQPSSGTTYVRPSYPSSGTTYVRPSYPSSGTTYVRPSYGQR